MLAVGNIRSIEIVPIAFPLSIIALIGFYAISIATTAAPILAPSPALASAASTATAAPIPVWVTIVFVSLILMLMFLEVRLEEMWDLKSVTHLSKSLCSVGVPRILVKRILS